MKIHGQDVTPDGISRTGKLILVELSPPSALTSTIETITWSGGRARVLTRGAAASWNRSAARWPVS